MFIRQPCWISVLSSCVSSRNFCIVLPVSDGHSSTVGDVLFLLYSTAVRSNYGGHQVYLMPSDLPTNVRYLERDLEISYQMDEIYGMTTADSTGASDFFFLYKTTAPTVLKFHIKYGLTPGFQNCKTGSGRIYKMAATTKNSHKQKTKKKKKTQLLHQNHWIFLA